jgi:hypothetical protein
MLELGFMTGDLTVLASMDIGFIEFFCSRDRTTIVTEGGGRPMLSAI